MRNPLSKGEKAMKEEFRIPVQLFDLGRIVVTRGALDETTHEYRMKCLSRHVRGDWGCVCKEDWAKNFNALLHGNRLLSAYPIDPEKPTGNCGHTNRLWVITEADRSVTTFLLPGEY
jgi:hypothetical protein